MKLFVSALAATGAVVVALALAHVQRKDQQRRAHVALLAGLAHPEQYRDAPIVIVIDIGSSSIRASCFALLRPRVGANITSTNSNDKNDVEWVLIDGSLQQIHGDCIDAHGEASIAQIAADVESVVSDTLAFLRATQLTNKIAGVGFSSFAMNIFGTDDQGFPVTPVYTYAGRRPSTAVHAQQLRALLMKQGALADFHDRTGTVIHPAYAPATFLRLHAEEPALVARVAKWQSISSFLIGKWTRTGADSTTRPTKRGVPMSFPEASWTGLFDFRHWQWDRALLALVHMDATKMPPLADASTPFVGLTPAFARKWPELQAVPFFLGMGDGAAANIGSKCINSSRIAVTIGTSAAIRVIVDTSALRSNKVPAGLWCYRISRDHVLLGGALSDGGSVYKFFRQTLQLSDADLSTQLESVRAAAAPHPLTVLPFLSGERAPGWAEDATCAISGITKWTTPVQVLHAALESVALRISSVFALLAPYADANAVVVASGTALTASPVWRQMLADALGKELVLERDAHETTSRGIAILLGSYLGLHTLEAAAALPAHSALHVAQPSARAHAASLDARHAQEALYRKLHSEA